MVVKIGDPTHGGDLSAAPDVLPFPKQLPDAAKVEVSVCWCICASMQLASWLAI